MAENAWKKQAQANKTVQPPKPPGAPPAWMKHKVEQPPPPQDASQTTATQPTTSVVNPAVQTPAQQPPPPGPPKAVPAWMKNKQQSGQPPASQPPPPVASTTGGSQPAWMKNKPTTSPVPTQRLMQQQKAKEEQEQKRKKHQQIRKQQQIKRQQRQIKMMAVQQQLSKAREEEDKKKPQKRAKKSPTKKAGQVTPLKPLKKLKNPTPVQTYHLLLDACLSKNTPYQTKLTLQKQFLKNIHTFCQSIQGSLSAYLVQHKPVPRKKNIINLQNIVAEYALVEGVSSDIGSMYFKCKNVQNLQNKFCLYSVLFYIVTRLAKKNGGFRLRAPLLSWLEVKGMYFLCEGVCQQIFDSVASPAQNFVQIHGQLTQLQKQLKQAGYDNIDRKMLSVKKVVIAQQQYYILYLSQTYQPTPPSHQNPPLTFPPFNPLSLQKLTTLSLLSTNFLSFPFTLMKQSSFSTLLSTYPTQKLTQTYIQLYQIAHAIRVVYASCQGELEEESFWKLVFEGNKNIWAMAATVAEAYWGNNGVFGEFKNVKQGKDVKVRNRIALGKVIQTMLPVRFGIGIQRYSESSSPKKQIQGRKCPYHLCSYVRQKCFPIESLQLYEVSQIFPKTITNQSKNKLSQQALTLQQQIISNSEQLYFSKLQYCINKSLFLLQKGLIYLNGDLVYDAIQNLEKYQVKRGMEIQKIGLWMTLIRVYMEAVESKLNRNVVVEAKPQQNQTNSQSNRFDKSKLQQSQVRQIQNSAQIKKAKQQAQEKSLEKSKSNNKMLKNPQMQYENKMLQKFGRLLAFIQELFEDQVQIWVHAQLYMVLATYYAKRGLAHKKTEVKSPSKDQLEEIDELDRMDQQANLAYFNRKTTNQRQKIYSKSHVLQRDRAQQQNQQKQSDSQSLVQQQLQGQDGTQHKSSHKYSRQCQKLIQTSHPIFIQYFGNKSQNLAEHLLSQSQIYYKINQLQKCQNSINEALKIYKVKSLAKNGRNVVTCNIILGKCLIRKGKKENNMEIVNKGVVMLENIVEDLGAVGVTDIQVMGVYQFLCENVSANLSKAYAKSKSKGQFDLDSNRHTKMEIYMQKMAEMSLSSGNIQSIKQIISKIVRSQLQFYSKQRAIVLKQLHERYLKQNLSNISEQNQESQQQMLVMNLQSIKYLEENKQNYGGLIEMIKWSFGILRSKNQTLDVNKATEIMENVLCFFKEKQIIGLLQL